MDYTRDDLTSLGAKLDAIDLTDGESAALHAILDATTPDEDVAGYAAGGFSARVSAFRLGQTVVFNEGVAAAVDPAPSIVLGESDMRG